MSKREREAGDLGKRLVDRLIVPVVRRSAMLQGIARRVATTVPGVVVPYADEVYGHLRDCFIRNGREGAYGTNARASIVERFEAIDANVRVAIVADRWPVSGGSRTRDGRPGRPGRMRVLPGGSTAKLSILASITGRHLTVFDSFEGLPESDAYNQEDHHVRLPGDWMNPWTPGDWAGALELVTANVKRWGEYGVCTFIKGWFKDTLESQNLPANIGLAFTDVDLASSARECLAAIWPRLADHGVYFSHDVGFIKVLKELTDDSLWREVLREPVPIIYGAGFGLGDTSRMLGFIVKGHGLSPEYIKSLTVDK